jgi:hypothetical protein
MAQLPPGMSDRLKALTEEYSTRATVYNSLSTGDVLAARARLDAVGEKICAARGRPLNLADLEFLAPSAELLRDLSQCLESDDPDSLSTAFFYLNALTLARSINSLPSDFINFLRLRLVQLLDNPLIGVSSQALQWTAVLSPPIEGYRDRMLQFLVSPEPALRRCALESYEGYANPGEIEPLLTFKDDGFSAEAAPLGPWEFVLRDRALATIEKQLGRTFAHARKEMPYEGSTVSWRDWQPFLTWHRSQKLRVVK